jgi:hypothetical protein
MQDNHHHVENERRLTPAANPPGSMTNMPDSPPTKRTILVVTAILVTVTVLFLGRFLLCYLKSCQEAARKSQAKGYLTHIQFLLQSAAEIPAAIRLNDFAGHTVACSWRAQALMTPEFPEMKKYRLDEKWSSPINTECARRTTNYFWGGGVYGSYSPGPSTQANILAVLEPEGAWNLHEPQSPRQFFEERGERLALIILPDSHTSMFEPRDIHFAELKQAVKQYHHIFALTANRKFVVLTSESIQQFEIPAR